MLCNECKDAIVEAVVKGTRLPEAHCAAFLDHLASSWVSTTTDPSIAVMGLLGA